MISVTGLTLDWHVRSLIPYSVSSTSPTARTLSRQRNVGKLVPHVGRVSAWVMSEACSSAYDESLFTNRNFRGMRQQLQRITPGCNMRQHTPSLHSLSMQQMESLCWPRVAPASTLHERGTMLPLSECHKDNYSSTDHRMQCKQCTL